jgi:hypothetical protein
MFALPQIVTTSFGLNKFAVEMNWIFNCFVFHWQDFDLKHNLIKEEFCQDAVSCTTDAFLP